MANTLLVDSSMTTLRAALNGLSSRQKVISQNLANIDTPGYRAQTLDFESALRSALDAEARPDLAQTDARHIRSSSASLGVQTGSRLGGSQRADGNNVDIDVELMDMSEVGIQYQALTQSAAKKLQLLKTIANSR